jgi:asparagine synthase (glutamine-hydrolysing)
MSKHWTRYSPDEFPLDIKLLWEPSRFGWAYVLVRAYRLTGDERYANGFWRYLESWRAANAPNSGPHWMSGQEIALRLMALLFSWYGFYPTFESNPDRLIVLAETIAVHADRIPLTLDYARAQENNHLISEMASLYSVGLLFPEFRDAARWKALGKKWIFDAMKRQFFSDGGYIQHSMNYHRFALQNLLWVYRLAQLNNEPPPQVFREIVERATKCLEAFVDPETGQTPNFGHNDGANAFRLSTCQHRDYRPIIQMAHHVLDLPVAYPSGPWDEAAVWFGYDIAGPHPAPYAGSQNAVDVFHQAGLAIIKGKDTRAILRCAEFSSRPGQSDQLHLDLWWKDVNVLRDAGTYLYNGNPPWDNRLSASGVHNTIVIDQREPMLRAGKFLWLDWAQGTLNPPKRSEDGRLWAIQAHFTGFRSIGVMIYRTVIKVGDHRWIVIDNISGEGVHSIRNGWLFPDQSWTIENSQFRLSTPVGEVMVKNSLSNRTALFRAGERLQGNLTVENNTVLGWYSPTYSVKEPALFLITESEGELPLRMVTYIGFGDVDWAKLKINLREPADPGSKIQGIQFEGVELEI